MELYISPIKRLIHILPQELLSVDKSKKVEQKQRVTELESMIAQKRQECEAAATTGGDAGSYDGIILDGKPVAGGPTGKQPGPQTHREADPQGSTMSAPTIEPCNDSSEAELEALRQENTMLRAAYGLRLAGAWAAGVLRARMGAALHTMHIKCRKIAQTKESFQMFNSQLNSLRQQNAIAVQKAVATADAENEAMLERLEEALAEAELGKKESWALSCPNPNPNPNPSLTLTLTLIGRKPGL